MGSTRVLRFLFAASVLTLSGRAVQAQRYWHDEQGRDAIRIDAWLPFLKGDGHKFFTGVLVPSVSIRVGEGFRVEGDVPLMRAGQDFGTAGGTQSSVRMGNPYLGLRIGEDDKPVSGTLGVRAPIAKRTKSAIEDLAVDAAVVSNFDDFEAFVPNVLTLRGQLEYRTVSARHLLFGVKGGPSMQINTSGDPTLDSEISFDYGIRTGYEGAKAQFAVGLTGRYLLTAPRSPGSCPITGSCPGKSFDARTDHHVSASIELRPGSVRPRLTLRVP
ncbi:MAG TPA: hypothetical protein VFU23_08260, partial [Gemmatimonadales bacterium]|nr:hypothetical protein [Gemmatimonadales bacterium]